MTIRFPRRGGLIFILFVASVVLVLIHRSRYLFGLLIEDGGQDAVPFFDVPLENTTLPLLVPKIIHQTYKNEDLPEHWAAAQYAVKYYHPDYQYMFWTDESGLEFIKTHYPSFVPLYLSYPYPIQRVDALRYFLLHHYGGVYIDLDIFPYRPLTPLLTFPAVACTTTPTGISNDILFSTPQHPFFTLVLNRLYTYNRNFLLPYITVMYTTGPLFFSAVWIEYLRGRAGGGGSPLERLRVLVKGPVRGDSYGFFKNIQGGSWHEKDLKFIMWMGKHVFIVTLVGFIIGFTVVFVLWFLLRRTASLLRSDRWSELQSRQPRVPQKTAYNLV